MILGMIAAMMIGNANIYPRAMEIVEVDKANDIAICVDAVGFEWEFSEPEDLAEGDIVICIMDTKGTDSIFDDEIVDVWWSGYTTQNLYKPLCERVIDI